MTRKEAEDLLKQYVTSAWLIKHSQASAAVMASLARRLKEDDPNIKEEEWWAVGLIHDLDFDMTQDLTEHGLKTGEILQKRGDSEELIKAVLAHNAEGLGLERQTRLDFALTCSESITGLIVATALVMPDKKLASVKASSVVKRMKKKDFARKVSRENIGLCKKIGLSIDEFAELAVGAMKDVSDELGL